MLFHSWHILWFPEKYVCSLVNYSDISIFLELQVCNFIQQSWKMLKIKMKSMFYWICLPWDVDLVHNSWLWHLILTIFVILKGVFVFNMRKGIRDRPKVYLFDMTAYFNMLKILPVKLFLSRRLVYCWYKYKGTVACESALDFKDIIDSTVLYNGYHTT